jgi:hypothetical protein
MTDTRPSNQSDTVDQFMLALDHPLKAETDALRVAILVSNARITEHIKWNAPSFCDNGEDRVTFRLPPKGGMQLIFHRGAKVKELGDFAFEDSTGLMKWATADRAVVTLQDGGDIAANTAAIVTVVNQWMDAAG